MTDEFDVPLDDEQALTAPDTPAEVMEEMNRESAEANAPEPDGALPPDIEAIWGEGQLDGTGHLAATTAHVLIEAWGIEAFRASEIHSTALLEAGRKARQQPIKDAFVKQYAKSKQVDDVIPEPEEIK
jgi:hypothetical protein